MNLTASGAVAALRSAFLEMLRDGPSDIAAFEGGAVGLARRCAAEAMGLAPADRDREPRRSPPRGRDGRPCATIRGEGPGVPRLRLPRRLPRRRQVRRPLARRQRAHATFPTNNNFTPPGRAPTLNTGARPWYKVIGFPQ